MLYYDTLYGEWELPKVIEELVHTKEMARLRNIVQGTLPNNLNILGPLPSRFQHGMGVCYLAQEILKKNQKIKKDFSMLLPVSGLLHDAGNPPFSHLSEPFLKEITGHDGESFLTEILDGSETEKILKAYGIHTGTVVKVVTGNWKPVSDVLNGSLDIDNLDNVARYAKATNIRINFRAEKIAELFSFENNLQTREWVFAVNFLENVLLWLQSWKDAREIVYKSIYSVPHMNMASMLNRALEFACVENELMKDFFFLNDYGAILYLNTANKRTVALIRRLARWECYDEVLNLEYTNPSQKIKNLVDDLIGRKMIADMIANKLKINLEDVCVSVFRGKENRKITVPIVDSSGKMYFFNNNQNDFLQVYKIKVYLAPNLEISKEVIRDLVIEEIS